MFTGIIEATAKILDKTSHGLAIERPKSFTDLKIGSSVSVAGVCLSVVKLTKSAMVFDVIPETLKKSRLEIVKKSDKVNLERAMMAGSRLDGHIVQGHVEGMGIVADLTPPPLSTLRGNGSLLVLRIPRALQKFIVPQDSIAIDGVSLTVAEVQGDKIMIALIPHTLRNTTLGSLKKRDRVNVETDVILRHLRHAADSGLLNARLYSEENSP